MAKCSTCGKEMVECKCKFRTGYKGKPAKRVMPTEKDLIKK